MVELPPTIELKSSAGSSLESSRSIENSRPSCSVIVALTITSTSSPNGVLIAKLLSDWETGMAKTELKRRLAGGVDQWETVRWEEDALGSTVKSKG